MEYAITIFRDEEADIWVATNASLGLVLESDSIDALVERVKLAVPELLSQNKVFQKPISLFFNIQCEL